MEESVEKIDHEKSGERVLLQFPARQLSMLDRVAARLCISRKEAVFIALTELDRNIDAENNTKSPAFNFEAITSALGQIERNAEVIHRMSERMEFALKDHARNTLLSDLTKILQTR